MAIRKIFQLRDTAQKLIKYQVGNGKDTFLWLDNWHLLGPLYKRVGDGVVFNMSRSLKAKVASIFRGGRWQ